MKKLTSLLLFCGILVLSACISTSSEKVPASIEKTGTVKEEPKKNRGSGIRITIPSPTFQGSTDIDNWAPQLIQDLLTSNFAEYSDMTVIDRANEQLILNEQRHSEDAIFSDEDVIELGNITNAQFVVASTIIKAGGQYNISFRVLDTSTNEIQASYNNLVNLEEIQQGVITKLATREILPQLGIELTPGEIKNLSASINTISEQKKIDSTVNLAKGMAAESKNKNIVEALSYYAASEDLEAEQRFEALSSNVSTGNIREDSKNEIALRKAWLKNFDDLQDYLDKHLLTLSYDVNPGEQKINFQTETVSIPFNYTWNIDENAFAVYATLAEGLKATGKENTWSISSNKKERSNFNITPATYCIYFVLKNSDGKIIGRSKEEINTSYSFNNCKNGYSRYEEEKKKLAEKSNENSSSRGIFFSTFRYSYSGYSNNSEQKNKYGSTYIKEKVVFDNIRIDDITDNLNFGIEQITVNEERSWNSKIRDYEYFASFINPPLNIEITGLPVTSSSSGSNAKEGRIKPTPDPVKYNVTKYRKRQKGPAGGYIFWADPNGVQIDGKIYHYMEICPVLYGRTVQSGSSKDFATSDLIKISRYGTVTQIGSYKVNNKLGHGIEATNALIQQFGTGPTAESLYPVMNCNYGGFTDWFIPNAEEQEQLSVFLYYNISDYREFDKVLTFKSSVSYNHWSSSNTDGDYPTPFAGHGSYDLTYLLKKYNSFVLVRYF